MQMGLGGGGGYRGPVFGGDGPAAVPASGGYPDTSASAMLFGPSGMSGGPASPKHSLLFGVACFAGLIFFAWALPR